MAVIMTSFTDLFSSAALAWIDEVITDTFDTHPKVMERLFRVRDSKQPHEQVTGVASFGQLAALTELQEPGFSDRVQGYSKTLTHARYGLAHEIGRMTMSNDRKGVLKDVPEQLGRSVVDTVETLAANIFNNGFTSENTPDGVSIFNTAHLTPAAGNFSNRPTNHVDIGATPLEDAMVQFMDQIDQAGKKIRVRPRFLVHPYELSFTVTRLLDSKLDPESAANAVNPLSRLGLEPVSWEYLTDLDAWFLVAETASQGLRWFWRQRPQVEHDEHFLRKSLLTSIDAWLSVGAVDARGLWGSAGA